MARSWMLTCPETRTRANRVDSRSSCTRTSARRSSQLTTLTVPRYSSVRCALIMSRITSRPKLRTKMVKWLNQMSRASTPGRRRSSMTNQSLNLPLTTPDRRLILRTPWPNSSSPSVRRKKLSKSPKGKKIRKKAKKTNVRMRRLKNVALARSARNRRRRKSLQAFEVSRICSRALTLAVHPHPHLLALEVAVGRLRIEAHAAARLLHGVGIIHWTERLLRGCMMTSAVHHGVETITVLILIQDMMIVGPGVLIGVVIDTTTMTMKNVTRLIVAEGTMTEYTEHPSYYIFLPSGYFIYVVLLWFDSNPFQYQFAITKLFRSLVKMHVTEDRIMNMYLSPYRDDGHGDRLYILTASGVVVYPAEGLSGLSMWLTTLALCLLSFLLGPSIFFFAFVHSAC